MAFSNLWWLSTWRTLDIGGSLGTIFFTFTSWRAIRPAESQVFMLAFRPHSDLLANGPTVSARPVCAPAGLLAGRVNRPTRKPVRTYVSLYVSIYSRFWAFEITRYKINGAGNFVCQISSSACTGMADRIKN